MNTYTVVSETIIARTYIVKAEPEEEAIGLAQVTPSDYDDEEICENWNVEEY